MNSVWELSPANVTQQLYQMCLQRRQLLMQLLLRDLKRHIPATQIENSSDLYSVCDYFQICEDSAVEDLWI